MPCDLEKTNRRIKEKARKRMHDALCLCTALALSLLSSFFFFFNYTVLFLCLYSSNSICRKELRKTSQCDHCAVTTSLLPVPLLLKQKHSYWYYTERHSTGKTELESHSYFLLQTHYFHMFLIPSLPTSLFQGRLTVCCYKHGALTYLLSKSVLLC